MLDLYPYILYLSLANCKMIHLSNAFQQQKNPPKQQKATYEVKTDTCKSLKP